MDVVGHPLIGCWILGQNDCGSCGCCSPSGEPEPYNGGRAHPHVDHRLHVFAYDASGTTNFTITDYGFQCDDYAYD